MWFPEKSESLLIENYGIAIICHWENSTTVSINLSENQLSIQPNKDIKLNVSYSSPSPFFKKLMYKTRSLRIEIAGKEYPRGNIPLEYNPAEDKYISPLEPKDIPFTVEINFVSSSIPQWNSSSIFLLALVVILSFVIIFLLRPKINRLEKEPDESLELRKKLAMESLKTLEKEREKGKVPDAYYNLIKGSFKKEAVRILRELEKRSRK
jgi:hypothetical protein